MSHPYVEGILETPSGKVRQLKTRLSGTDKLGAYKVRWGLGRYGYVVSPGLYAIGQPSADAPVLVTANYKMTFDIVRSQLGGENVWLLVLDTKGINVWCAAGKGTFGTAELVQRINKVQLNKVVNHRTVIVPQLGAPGVAAYLVTKATGFKVVFGPVRAEDIKPFLAVKLQASKSMRTVRFDLYDRIVLTPMELVPGFKWLALILVMLVLINSVGPLGLDPVVGIKRSLYNIIPFVGAYLIGAFWVPVLLPYIPVHSFALKGALLGMLWVMAFVALHEVFLFANSSFSLIGAGLIMLALSSYLALNFTGSTTFTNLSGTTKETLYTIPLAIVASLVGAGLLIADRFFSI